MILRMSVVALLLALSGASALRAGDEPATLAPEAFKLALKDAKSIEEKAALLHFVGVPTLSDPTVVAEVSRFLNAGAGDIRFLLPTASMTALGRLRGNRAAAQRLVQAIPAFKQVPCMQRKLIAAICQVGHVAALPALEEILRGSDESLALFTIGALRDFPSDVTLDVLIRSWEWMESRKPKVRDELKNAYGRLGGEMLKVVQQISGESYPSMTEMQKWWMKRGAEWKEKAAAQELEREKKGPAPVAAPPPALILEMLFNDRGASSTSNGGASSAWCPVGAFTRNKPAWSTEVPPSGGTSSLDWGKDPGPYAVDVAGMSEHLRNLKSFTVTGWLNCRSSTEGKGGNRILSWLDREGVEIVYRADGSLQVGVNQKAEESEARTPSGVIPVLDPANPSSLFDSWRFFAVTYDSTTLTAEIKIYVGERGKDAALSVSRPGVGRKIAERLAPALTIGNVPSAMRTTHPQSMFRGLLDEIRIFGSSWDGSGALPLEALIKLQNRS
jgi:hypothetical protein